ncbi:hypothetical protein BDV29DRAFT_184319 [Aspergillus leporis]|jgi:NADH:ubiquinone oxidoreductase subunit H|uniref:Uncharacterized protein n=1 Tax=Aspergillus leporis TaxID=41062 RepID=A0A5N5WN17_9EURO|nr:hypothetical protein BDV29DRAFT_184319 [Aspergillus leporis]
MIELDIFWEAVRHCLLLLGYSANNSQPFMAGVCAVVGLLPYPVVIHLAILVALASSVHLTANASFETDVRADPTVVCDCNFINAVIHIQ